MSKLPYLGVLLLLRPLLGLDDVLLELLLALGRRLGGLHLGRLLVAVERGEHLERVGADDRLAGLGRLVAGQVSGGRPTGLEPCRRRLKSGAAASLARRLGSSPRARPDLVHPGAGRHGRVGWTLTR